MDLPDPLLGAVLGDTLHDARGHRQHRYMESADFNAVFRELFGPLRHNIRRGLTIEGQLFGLELDACIPGELLGTVWIPPATRGIDEPALLAEPARRRRVFERLLDEPRPEAMFAYVCERTARIGGRELYMEVVSVDGGFAVAYPVAAGRGWQRRELLPALPHRVAPVAMT